MQHLFTSPMLKLLSKVCPILLRRHFTAAKLEKLIEFDISSSGERVTYNFSSQEAHCNFSATNLSPFDFVIDRIAVVVTTDGASFDCLNFMPVELKSSARVEVYAHGKSPMLPDAAAAAKKSQRARVEICAYVNSRIHPFIIRKSLPDVSNVKFYGC